MTQCGVIVSRSDCCGRGCPGCEEGKSYNLDELLTVALEELEANRAFYREDQGPADYLVDHVEKLEAAIRYLKTQLTKVTY